MNQTVSIFAIGFKIKKLIALVVIVMTVSLTLPVMAVFSPRYAYAELASKHA